MVASFYPTEVKPLWGTEESSGWGVGAWAHCEVAHTDRDVATHCSGALPAQVCRMATHLFLKLTFAPLCSSPSRV
ncbi:hypothetical protein [Mycobacterium simulans]|uniref:hypothetical protein n=1 Tax=Mycobacterium simulans TaxID=627089 RepID=UPI0017495A5A